MSRAPLWRALLALAVVAASLFAAITIPARLGLDLRGGTQIVLETRDSPTVVADAEATDRALEVLRRRVDALGVAEPTLARSGENRIVVELPGLQDPREAAEVVGRTAQLQFHPVLGAVPPTPEGTGVLAPQAPAPQAPAPEGTAPEGTAPEGTAPEGTAPEGTAPEGTAPEGTAPEGTAPEATEPGAEAPEATPTEQTDGSRIPAVGTAAPPSEPAADATQPAPAEPAPAEPVPAEPAPAEPAPAGEGVTVPDEDGAPIVIGPVTLTGEGVDAAEGRLDEQSLGWQVVIDFDSAGGAAWAALTGQAACAPPGDPARRVAITLDEEVISSPAVNPDVPCGVGITGGTTLITGDFSQEEAQGLAVLIEGGALPVPVEIIQASSVGPTLGASAIEASATAAVIGVSITGLFILFVYRLVGAMATIALASYALIAYAALVTLGATLTLPGLAGFVLAIGMAVDANVLVFERAREEFNSGRRKGLRSALVIGFNKAWSAILDSNVTTLLAAGLLFFLASGPVRGFGVTLTIGVLASMVSALVISRVLTEFAVSRGLTGRRPEASGLASTGRVRRLLERSDIDLMGRRRLWLSLAVGLVLVSLAGIGARGLDLGVEFTGGRLVDYTTSQQLDVDSAREAVADAGFPRAVVQTSGAQAGTEGISVRSGQMNDEEVFVLRDVLAEAGGGQVEVLRNELIGPSLGDELRNRALIALGVALAAQLLYLAVRFRWTFGAAAVVAMLHDVIVVVGFFAWTGKAVDGVFLAALLTVIGYSVNDSVVIFDRVREMVRAEPGGSFAQITGRAVLNTVPRTVNTGLGALFILVALAALGGSSLTDFALALIAGIVVGSLSSIFLAAPLAVVLEQRVPRPPQEEAEELNPHLRAAATSGRRVGTGRGRNEDGWDGAVI